MTHASRVQPGLGHLRTILEEPSGPETHPACGEEVDSCIEANVDKTPLNVTASAPPPPQRPEERDVMVVPIVQDLPFLDEAVKRHLERHIVKMKIEQRYGLPTKVLQYEKNLQDIGLGQTAHQPPSPQRRTVLPYRSPFWHWGKHVRPRKPAGQLPALKEEREDAERGPGTQGDVHHPSPFWPGIVGTATERGSSPGAIRPSIPEPQHLQWGHGATRAALGGRCSL